LIGVRAAVLAVVGMIAELSALFRRRARFGPALRMPPIKNA
jgi:hypothetical protein